MTVQLPLEQVHPLDMAPLLRQLQRDGVIHRVRTAVGDDAWLVTGYAEVRRLLADERLGRSHPDPVRAPRQGASVLFGGPIGNYDTEQADNARVRSLLQPHFSPARMRGLRPRVEELTAGLLDDLAGHGPPADLHQALALPLPIQVICELLGVPYADRDQFRAWSEAVGDARDRARSEQGMGELFRYGRSWWPASASSQVRTSSPGCAPTASATTRSRCCRWPCCSPATRRPWWRSAWVPCACSPIRASSRPWSVTPGGSPPRWRRCCALRAAAAAASPATPAPTCRSGTSPCAPVSWCCWTTAPPTTIPRSFPAPVASTSPARTRPTSRSGTAPTTASAPRSPASSCTWSSPSCSRASPGCGSRSPSSSCGCVP